jgi:nucleoid-associated protein YgaU
MIAAAEAARQKAAEVGGEWRDVGKMIKSAETLMGAGEFDKAIEAASAAKFQAEKGYEQALAEKDADMPDYMRKALE